MRLNAEMRKSFFQCKHVFAEKRIFNTSPSRLKSSVCCKYVCGISSNAVAMNFLYHAIFCAKPAR